jgi:hypothetical protein
MIRIALWNWDITFQQWSPVDIYMQYKTYLNYLYEK